MKKSLGRMPIHERTYSQVPGMALQVTANKRLVGMTGCLHNIITSDAAIHTITTHPVAG